MGLALVGALAACGGETPPPDRVEPPPFRLVDELPAPPEGDGFQIGTPEFEVAAGTEVQDCYFFAMPKDQETWVKKIQIAQYPGTHHMNIFRLRSRVNLWGGDGDVVRGGECWNSANWADWPLVTNSQLSSPDEPVNNWTLPEGVGMKFEPGEIIMIQTHYVNATTQVTPGKGQVLVNFHTAPKSSFKHELGTVFATNQGIRICPGQERGFETTCNFARDSEVTIVAANSHFHSRGTRFTMAVNDAVKGQVGEQFYENFDWEEPEWANDLNIKVPLGGGVQYRCEYMVPADTCGDVNQDCCFTFGGFVETQEHCNIFVYYYPKQSTDVGCF